MKEKVTATKNLRDRLLSVALKEIKSQGAHGLSLRHIAKSAGCTPMATYRHFASKEALLAEIATEGFFYLRNEMLECLKDNQQNPLLQIEEAGCRYIRMALKKPEHLLMMFGGFIPNHDEFKDLKTAGDSAFFCLVDMMKNCQAARVLPKDDPIKQALAAWSIVHGFSMLIINGNLSFIGVDLKNYEEFASFVSRSVLQGLVSR